MTDSMKFGPEWLRNLTADGCNNSGGGGITSLRPPRYQLAEHRYGREEMLALFDRTYQPPEPLSNFSTLFVEKTQFPLALIQMTEDETRLWNGGVTSSSAVGRGRGGSVDRGGRGRIGRTNPHFRGVGYEDPMEGPRSDPIPFPGRTRAFDRSTSERPWSERNGVGEPVEWNGSISPRKESGRGLSGSLLMESNWRRHRTGEDEDAWRMSSRNDKWAKSSWRDGGSEMRDRNDKGECDDGSRRAIHRPYDSHGIPIRRTRNSSGHHEFHDNLPEWVNENAGDSGGSFDATGAFHGIYSDDDDDRVGDKRRQPRIRRVSEGSTLSSSKSSPNTKFSGFTNQGSPGTPSIVRAPRNNSSGAHVETERPKSLHFEQHKDVLPNQERRSESPSSPTKKLSNPIVTPQKPTLTSSEDREGEISELLTAEKLAEKSAKETPGKTEQKIKMPPGSGLKFKKTQVADEDKEKSEDPLKRLEEDVAKLIDTGHKESAPPISAIGAPPSKSSGNPSNPNPNIIDANSATQEKWYYRDPQGEVQGPFLASEMAEWWKQGYFSSNLLIRRTYDERYATLGDLVKLYGRVPFKPGPPIPVLKLTENIMPPSSVTNAIPNSTALSKTGMDDPILMYQYNQLRMQQNLILFKQAQCNAITKLSQSEHWSSLSPADQNQLVLQYIRSVDPDIVEAQMAPTNTFMPAMTPPPPSSSVMQLFPQLQQTMKPSQDNHVPPQNLHASSTIDPVQQLMQQMSGMRNIPHTQMPPHTINPNPPSTSEENAIKSWIRQLGLNANGPPKPPQVEAVWPQPPPHLAQFSSRNWMPQVNHGQSPAMPPGHMPGSLWEMHPKDMKTEQQILEETNLKIQEEKKKQEEVARKQEELRKKAEEEVLKRKQQEEELARLKAAEEAAQRDEERRKEEEKRRKEEEKRKQEEEILKLEEKKRKEEDRKREEKRKYDEELNKKKQEEEKKKREEQKKIEEKLKKEEEKRRKLEEEQKRKEEERLKKEEEARKKVEAEENARKAEQRRREVEALKKLQERSKAPWAQSTPTPPTNLQASLADIQRLEREKKAEEQRLQLLLQQQQLAQQRAAEANAEALALDSSKRLQFKWAEKLAAANNTPQIKSLAQIQQEEQEKMSKVKQQEREKQEKEKFSQKDVFVTQNVNIWGTASQSLSWSNPTVPQSWSISPGSGGGFWEEPVSKAGNPPPLQKLPMMQKATIVPSSKQTAQPPQLSPQQQQQNNKSGKSKSKKEEELVKKLFEQNTAKTDDFTQWCAKALSGLQVSVDIPTFIGFLRDIEAAYEVKEYVRLYLGEGKQCAEFAKQFLEKRSKWRSSQRPQAQADDLCKPAPAVNPNTTTDFQEVKSKSKKPKKGKMCKVDSRMLGFSVMSAPDRINVGDRDYGEGV